jgi:hypothetical protein
VPGDTARRYRGPNGELISYRQYRNLLERGGQVHRLDIVSLANQRRKQHAFNDIIDQLAKVRTRQIENLIEHAEEIGDDEVISELEQQLRYVRTEAIRSPARKEALQTLKKYGHRKHDGRYNNVQDELKVREALIALGRREGIPDWVPVGGSDRFRSGRLRRNRIPRTLQPYGR